MNSYAKGDKLQELQRFAELGRLSANLLHEISNPLTAALLHLELDSHSQSIRKARQNIKLIKSYVEASRQQFRGQNHKTSFHIQPQLNQVKRVVAPLASKAGVRLEVGLPPNCKIYGDIVKFQQILTNLIVNAIESYRENITYAKVPLIKVKMSCSDDYLTMQVIDWGKGITEEALPRLFDAFYTTKNQSNYGLGIGLAIVKQYVTMDFKGSIKASSSPRHGTRFTVKIRALSTWFS